MILIKNNTPRWLIFLIDACIIIFSVSLAYLLRFNFSIPENEMQDFPKVLLIILIVRIIGFVISKTYACIVRHTNSQDVMRIFLVIFSGSLFFVLIDIVTFYFINGINFIPYSIIIIDFITSSLILTLFRIIVKLSYLEFSNSAKTKLNIIIFGAGEAGIITKRVLDRDAGSKYKVFAFIDDDQKKLGKKLEGIKISGYNKLKSLLEEKEIDQLIISVQNLDVVRKKEIIELCIQKNVIVLSVPPVISWINGELSYNQIKKIKIEDLLGRNVIKLDEKKISRELAGKVVLITGASGSIGGELARQVSRFSCKQIILIDQAESPLFHLELECSEKFPHINYEFIVADICNKSRIENIFRKFSPDIVFHAAAYKHVPVMENNILEALQTNISGSKILSDFSIKYNVKKFILISTDKAVNPTNVMGATKRIAEIYIQSLQNNAKTSFITTRFGNVLGSNGSVIPLFRKQIEKGGPITITHPDITRFFMTIPEACQLVLEACTMGNGGEIFVFDMGKSVRIVDLAKKMIRLSGLTLEKDIKIKFTGLRPGEKLYEELLNNQENTIPTHHPQILIGKVKEYDPKEIVGQINNLIEMNGSHDEFEIVKKMKEIVPEYISRNSVFEKLDLKK